MESAQNNAEQITGEQSMTDESLLKEVRGLKARESARKLLLTEARLAVETKELIVEEIGQIAEASTEADIKTLTEAVTNRYVTAIEATAKMGPKPLMEAGAMQHAAPQNRELASSLGKALYGRGCATE